MAIESISSNSISTADLKPKSTVAADSSAVIAPVAAPSQASALVQQPDAVPGVKELEDAVKNIQKVVQAQSPGIEFSIDEDTHHTVVKVIDRQTNEVLRQIPTEEALRISKALDQVVGLLIRQKA